MINFGNFTHTEPHDPNYHLILSLITIVISIHHLNPLIVIHLIMVISV